MNTVSHDVPGIESDSIPIQPASLDIWDKKYRLKDRQGGLLDKDIDGTWQRVARALAEAEATPALREQWGERFLWALRHGAIPAGRITANAGASEHKPSTSTINCTVSGSIRDSMDDILGKVHEAGMTLKAGCGIGYEFSTLRPRGAYVSGAGAQTSGPLSFMDIYDKMCFTISSAGGRRGAQMATFDIGHPDVIEFIRAKREDGRLRQFNLSLLITEPFMRAVNDDAEWPLAFPLTPQEVKAERIDLNDSREVLWRDWPLHEGYVVNADGLVACRIHRRLRARALWDLIMRSTYDYAEPGFILIDRVNEENNNWFCENIRATNPCVTADTWVHTSEGPRQVAELIGRATPVRCDGRDYPTTSAGFFYTGDRDVVEVSTVEGYRLRCTPDHLLLRASRFGRYAIEESWCAAGDLREGDMLVLNDHRRNTAWQGELTEAQGYLLGLLVGDGTLKRDKAVLSVWTRAAAVNDAPRDGVDGVMAAAVHAAKTLPHRADFTGWVAVSGRNEHRLALAALRDLALEVGMAPGAKAITPAIERSSSDGHRGFLRGLFDADGSVQGTQQKGVSIRLSQSDLPLLEAAQRMLLRLGIASRLYSNRRLAGSTILPNGRGGSEAYATKAQHELVIAGSNLVEFEERIGFNDTAKADRLRALLAGYLRSVNRERFVVRVKAIEAAGTEPVYDVQVADVHRFDGNGLTAHNCGEQPLPPYGSCLLGSINLTLFVRDAFTDRAQFDWPQFRQVVRVFTRMLDNVVEMHGLPLSGQRREIERKRRHGMGFLGLGSALTMLRMKYGEADSIEFTERVAREMAIAGWEVGVELAQEKGAAPIMDEEFEVTAAMLRQRPELARDGVKVGDRVPGRVLLARYSRYMQRLATVAPELVQRIAETGVRFTHHSSIAPTGTISLSLANNASNGIEPSFAHHYVRNVIRAGKKTKDTLDVYSLELLAYRTLIDADAAPDNGRLPGYFTTADDILPAQHVDIQAAAQRWVDSSISKTANVPTDFPFDEFKDIYRYAHARGLKGCTTFRFNPDVFQGVLVKTEDLANTLYRFVLEDGSVVEARGNEEIEYDGETHSAANLFDALKEGYYGRF